MWSRNNPFLWDIAALDDVQVEDNGAAALEGGRQVLDRAGPPPADLDGTRQHSTKLPEFWPHAPAMWFARAECRFEMVGIASQRQRFMCVADALPYEIMRLVADLVAAPPADQPYERLKERLLLAHALTPTQRAEKLFGLPPVGDRRPSDLLAAMFEHCPAGEESTALFRALFLTRLPPEIRVHLETAEEVSLKQLALRADQLWLTLAAKKQAVAAAVEAELMESGTEAAMAAVRGKFFAKNKQKKQPADSSAVAQPAAAADGTGGAATRPKIISMQLCWRHAKYGSKAFRCADKSACQWPEN
jgi:hypothetical protein